MKAFIVQKYSKKDSLVLSDVPKPIVQAHQVLVAIHSAGVNQLDAMIQRGDLKLFLPYATPFVNGHDMAGVITQVGSGVKKFKVGDEVYARVGDYRIGTFSEYIAVDEADLALKPKNLSMEEAASVPLVGLTAWQALVEVGNIQKWQKVFIQAGSGGVGTFAIQLAKHLGAFVATTTSQKNRDFVQGLGADLIIDYKTENFEEKIQGYDLVLHSNHDPKILEKSLHVLKPGGQLISLVWPPTPEFAQQVGSPWYLIIITKLLSLRVRQKAKKRNIKFTFLFMRADGNQLAKITQFIEGSIIQPVIDKIFIFEQTNDAIEYIQTGRSKWKVIIKIQ